MSILDNLKKIGSDPLELKNQQVEPAKRYIIVSTKDLSKQDKDIFESFGKLIVYDDRYVNLKYEDLEFDYLYVDIREKINRYNLASQNIEKFNVVVYCSFYEKIEDFIEQIKKKTNEEANVVTSIPNKCISKEHFDNALLIEKLSSPSFLKSVLKYVARCLGK
jgi:hypothetical protein